MPTAPAESRRRRSAGGSSLNGSAEVFAAGAQRQHATAILIERRAADLRLDLQRIRGEILRLHLDAKLVEVVHLGAHAIEDSRGGAARHEERAAGHGGDVAHAAGELASAVPRCDRLLGDAHVCSSPLEMNGVEHNLRLGGRCGELVIERQQILAERDAARQQHDLLRSAHRRQLLRQRRQLRQHGLRPEAAGQHELARLRRQFRRAWIPQAVARRPDVRALAFDDARNGEGIAPVKRQRLVPRNVVGTRLQRRRTRAGDPRKSGPDARVIARQVSGRSGQVEDAGGVHGSKAVDHRSSGLEHRFLVAGRDRLPIDDEHDDSPVFGSVDRRAGHR